MTCPVGIRLYFFEVVLSEGPQLGELDLFCGGWCRSCWTLASEDVAQDLAEWDVAHDADEEVVVWWLVRYVYKNLWKFEELAELEL